MRWTLLQDLRAFFKRSHRDGKRKPFSALWLQDIQCCVDISILQPPKGKFLIQKSRGWGVTWLSN